MGKLAPLLHTPSRMALFLAATAFLLMPGTLSPTYAGPSVVAELFTSQGCSSCPPADQLLEELAKRDDVLALSLPVDYWDYLGWSDTLASPDNSARQRAYAAHRGDRSVYTPQIVVNGIEHVVGGNRHSVQEALKRAPRLSAEIDMKHNDMGIEATVTGSLPKGAKMATVFFISLNDREEIPIGRGENAGATITYVNVVKTLQPIGMWSGGSETFRMPKSELVRAKAERCAILIQLEDEDGPGQIIGAAIVDWPAAS